MCCSISLHLRLCVDADVFSVCFLDFDTTWSEIGSPPVLHFKILPSLFCFLFIKDVVRFSSIGVSGWEGEALSEFDRRMSVLKAGEVWLSTSILFFFEWIVTAEECVESVCLCHQYRVTRYNNLV